MNGQAAKALQGTADDLHRWSVRFRLGLFYGLPPFVILLAMVAASTWAGVSEPGSPAMIVRFGAALLGSAATCALFCLGGAAALRWLAGVAKR